MAEAGDSVEASDAVKVVGLWPLRAADQLLYFHPLFVCTESACRISAE